MKWYRMTIIDGRPEDNRMFLEKSDERVLKYIESILEEPCEYDIEEIINNEPIRFVFRSRV